MAVWMWRVTKREKSRISKTNRQMVVPSTETGNPGGGPGVKNEDAEDPSVG